jgi:hypothetical protein
MSGWMLWRIGEIFSKTLEELEPYLVQFDENGKILDELWSKDCQVGGDDRRPIIVITHDDDDDDDDIYLRPAGPVKPAAL